MSTTPSAPTAPSSNGLSPDNRAAFRTKTVATRLSVDELEDVESAAKRSGKTLAEWLREIALRESRRVPADPMELLLSEVAATRYMLLNLFHGTAQAHREGKQLLPESVLKIRETADARKLGTARKMLQDFLAANAKSEGQNGAGQ